MAYKERALGAEARVLEVEETNRELTGLLFLIARVSSVGYTATPEELADLEKGLKQYQIISPESRIIPPPTGVDTAPEVAAG